MQDPDFRFKQFAISHSQCAMKVNTDGILLGAWTELNQAQTALDIGTGTGLISLMLAQRSEQLQTRITAVEIDPAAAEQAQYNVSYSPWAKRVEVEQSDVQHYANNNRGDFDLIVSNPPYFSNALKAPNKARELARHNDHLSFSDLLASSARMAKPTTLFSLILPCEEAERLLALSEQHNWFLSKQCLVHTVTGKPATRTLFTLTRNNTAEVEYSSLTIRDKNNNYSSEFTALCQDFYLAM